MNLEVAALSDAAMAQLLQVTAVALGAGIMVRLFARSRPHLAYLLWILVIVKCLTPPLAASRTSVFSWAWAEEEKSILESSPIRESESVLVPMENELRRKLQSQAEGVESNNTPAVKASHGTNPTDVLTLTMRTVCFSLWTLGTLFFVGYVGFKWLRFQRSVQLTSVPASATFLKHFTLLSARLGLRNAPRVLLSSQAIGPLSMGVFRPTIILPAELVDDRWKESLEPILVHELLHLRRGDVMVNHLQVVAQTLWWFHPLVWWANREARRERERCCDEAVLSQITISPAGYARTLLDVLDLRHRFSQSPLLPIASASDVNDQRLRHIMRPNTRFNRHTPKWCWLVLAVAAALCLPGAGLTRTAGMAGEPSTETKAPDTTDADSDPAANENREGDETESANQTREPEFSPRHHAAVEKLQELNASYGAWIDGETNEPRVDVGILRNWKGTAEDWKLLRDLDLVSILNVEVIPGEEEGLEVVADLEQLSTVNLMSPTSEALARIAGAKQLRLLLLTGNGQEKTKLGADDFEPLRGLTGLKSLAIQYLPVDDTALKSLAALSELERLHLVDLPITDAGIAALNSLSNLQDISLYTTSHGTELTSGVSGVGFAKLTSLPNLKKLWLGGPSLTDEGLAGISQLHGLEDLYLGNVPSISASGIGVLGSLSNLKKLSIWAPELELVGADVAPLSRLDSLRSIMLVGGITLDDAGATQISRLDQLRQIDIPTEHLTEQGILDLVQLPDLRALNLSNASVTQRTIEPLTQHDQLLDLNLAGTSITDEELANFSNFKRLVRLNLSNTAITDSGAERLHSLNTLRSLNLTNTKLTKKCVERLESALTNLENFSHDFLPEVPAVPSGVTGQLLDSHGVEGSIEQAVLAED